MSRQKGYKIYETDQVNKFRGAYKAAADGMPQLKQAIEDAKVSEYHKRKMWATITAVESCLERQLIMPIIRGNQNRQFCRGCGADLKNKKDTWQFCPVCGQRFRDQWVEMQEPFEADTRDSRDEGSRCKHAEASRKWREKKRKEAEERRAELQRLKHAEACKTWRENNKEYAKEYDREKYQRNKQAGKGES